MVYKWSSHWTHLSHLHDYQRVAVNYFCAVQTNSKASRDLRPQLHQTNTAMKHWYYITTCVDLNLRYIWPPSRKPDAKKNHFLQRRPSHNPSLPWKIPTAKSICRQLNRPKLGMFKPSNVWEPKRYTDLPLSACQIFPHKIGGAETTRLRTSWDHLPRRLIVSFIIKVILQFMARKPGCFIQFHHVNWAYVPSQT